ncbi:MAG TPA: glycoside hydrolase domain-containing protein [Bacteroidales bacterium]|nr:glycoside hydrolase domain-containing protein [Bacteroidales bacterium]
MKRNEFSRRFLLSVLMFSVFALNGNSQINKPSLKVPFIKSAPVIDGKLTDGSWQNSAEMSEFVNWSLDSYVRDPVSVFLYFDEKNLYVAFRNSDTEAESLNKTVSPKGPRDTFLWGRNHAMVGISYRDTYIQVMADPKGTMTDWKNSDIEWNGTWQYNASINKSDWTGEFSIPFSDFGLTGKADGTELTVTLSRSYPRGESSNWNGKCNLSSGESAKCDIGRWPVPVPGNNRLSLKASNTGKEAVRIRCELELTPLNGVPEFINQAGQGPSSELQIKTNKRPLIYRSEYNIPAGGKIDENLQYSLPYEGSYYASAIVMSEDGSIIRRSVDYWFTSEPNKKKLFYLKENIGEAIAAMARVSNPVADLLKAEAEEILTDIQKLENSADSAWKSGKWDDLSIKVKNIEIQTAQHLHKVKWGSYNNWSAKSDFGIALAHSVIKLRKDALFPLPVNDKIEISLGGNEYESFQLALLPFGNDLKNLKVEVSDLKDNNGNLIPKNNIETSLVEYNYIDWQAAYVAGYKGWHPDPLIPFKGGNTISGKDLCRPLWITVYAPAGTKAGDYSGTITVGADGMKNVTATVRCRVWGFNLPVASHLKTHSWDQIEYLADFYNLEELPVEWYQNFCGLLLKNHMNPGSAGVNYLSETPDSKGKYDFSKVEKVLKYCIDRGLERFSIVQMRKGLYTPEEAEKVYKFVEAYTKFLKEKGWLDKALVELWDEPTDLEWPYIKERAERLKKIDPDLRLQLFAEGGPYDFFDRSTDKYGLNDLVDIWAPVNIIESPETQAKGGEIWTYFCTLARESAPNFFIDCPAIYQRSIAWYCWMYGVDGFEHWSTNYFWRNTYKGKPMDQKWPNVPWDSRTYYYFNGEGQMVYPGPDGVTYSSLRLENFRDGMDDYEYLYKLKELLSKYEVGSTDPELKEYRQLLYPEDYLLYKYPRKIKVTLENTLRYPDQPERILAAKKEIAMAIEKLQNRER